MNNYAPKAGSLPARLLEHLRANGGTMTRSEIANGFAIESKNVHSNLKTIIKHGLLVMHQVEGQTTRFGLPGSAPEVTAPVPPASMTMMKSPNSLLIERKTTTVNKRERSLVALAAIAPATEAPPPPHCRPVGGRRRRAVRSADQCRRHRHPFWPPGQARAPFHGAVLRPE